MTKKILIFCLAFIFIFQCAASAKKKEVKEIPLEDRVKISVEVADKTSFQELDTAEILRGMIEEQLFAKKIFNIISDEEITTKYSDLKTLGEKKSASDVGELLYFNPAEVTYGAGTDGDLIQENYLERGIDYVVKCQILALGVTSKSSDLIGFDPGFGIGIGSHRHSHFGIGIYTPIGIKTKQTVYCTAVNVQFIKVDTNVVLWQRNLIGQAIRHKKPKKGYDDASDEAYLKSIKNAAEIITERVEKYSTNFLIKKDDDSKEDKK